MSSKNTLPWPESARFSRHPALYVERRGRLRGADSGRLESGCGTMEGGWRRRRQALLESNPPRNSQRETHRKAVGRSGLGLAFAHGSSAFDRFPHASKTRMSSPVSFGLCGSALTPCKQHPDGKVPTMVLSETLRPTAFLGYRGGIRWPLRLGLAHCPA